MTFSTMSFARCFSSCVRGGKSHAAPRSTSATMADAAHATLRWLGTVLGCAAIMGGREVGFLIRHRITFSLFLPEVQSRPALPRFNLDSSIRTIDRVRGRSPRLHGSRLMTSPLALRPSQISRGRLLVDDDRAAAHDAHVRERLGVVVELLRDVALLPGRRVEQHDLCGLQLIQLARDHAHALER